MVQGIYLHRLGNEILYVGQSTNIQKRKNEHLRKLKKNNHDNIHLQRIFNKNPEIELGILVEEVKDREKLTEREIHWIKQLSPRCNIALPDEKDKWMVSEETKKKISGTFRSRKIHYKRTEEDKQQISRRRKLYYQQNEFSDEIKKKISESVRALWEDEDYRKHMVEAHRGKTTSQKQKDSVKYMNHLRWHIRRDIVNENCKYCKEIINAR